MLKKIACILSLLTFSQNSSADINILYPRNVLIIGDSEACAVGTSAKNVASEFGIQDAVAVECKIGSTIQYWEKNFKRVLAKHPKTDVVVVFLGTNHYSSIVPPQTSNLLSQIKESSSECLWVGPVAVHGKNWPINEFLKQSVSDNCSYFDTENFGLELVDGIHPEKKEAYRWLKSVWNDIPMKRKPHVL